MPDTPQPVPKHTAGDPGSVVEFPGSSEGRRPPNNLPLQLSSFVGRGREVAEVEALFSEHRLLTLTGAGGSGKTRLALAVASEVLDGFDDGAWLVELAPLSEPELVAQAVAAVFGVRETPGTTLTESLTDYLLSKKTLLVLDNCEHLVSSCASLAETLLKSCPNLRILATSREALDVLGETLFVVPPLSLPDPRHLPALEGLSRYEAARLFVERAKALRPGFEITEGNAMAVAQVCYRLDGIPLAIELAAARTKVLSVEQISGRLEESLRLLSTGGRTAMPHHGTLRATMDWSYGLLGREERTLFGRLSVFAGSFALEAAEAVGSGEGIEEAKVLDLLSSLVDKSLVLVVERDDETRYRILETVRQYATEKLEEAREAERVRRRHAEHYLALAEGAEAGLKGSAQTTWLRRLAADHDNLRAALWWSLESEGEQSEDRRTDLGLRLVVALWLFWNIYGSSEGLRRVEAALARSSGRTLVRAKALNGAGWMSLWQGDYEKGVSLLEEALSVFEQLGDKDSAAVSLAYLGMTALRRGDGGRATALREEAERLIREPLERRSLAEVHFFLAAAASVGGDYERSVASFEESRALFDRLQDARGATRCATSLGMTAVIFDDYERAAVWLEEGLRVLRGLKDQPGIAFSLLGVAAVAGSRGESARAARLWGAAEGLREAIGLSLGDYERSAYGYEERIAAARSQVDETTWETAWAEGREITSEEAIEYALQTPPTAPEDPAASAVYPAGLSAREVEVLRLVARGMTNARIAGELYISTRTVNAHLRSAYHKIGSSTRAEATRFALEHDLL